MDYFHSTSFDAFTKAECCVFLPASGCCTYPKAGQNIFSANFQVDFSCEITENGLKQTKKLEKRLKKMFRPVFGCAQHQKAGRITQHQNPHIPKVFKQF